MKLATLRVNGSTRAVRLDGDRLIDLGAADLGEGAAFAPVVPRPSKVVCVGLNYKNHIQEMGRDLPRYPTLFAKFAGSLIGATDEIARPAETGEFDWEVEPAAVIGAPVRRARGRAAEKAIAGFTVLNDITCRDWRFRTREWLQGKMWDSSTPVGPYVVTPAEPPGGVRPRLEVALGVDGEVMQRDNTGDLLFDPVALVEYVSTVVRLDPGDIIATGTPGSVGHARDPKRYLTGDARVVAEIRGVGRVENTVAGERAA
ncbi:fumarylacetoacetate hydrolase family protein [Spongiactinospora sp. 9N601]|uniref:fumarylacetoacetate hydrolase family protein n=1 Tax=Spongiactinospora sp. 9N601 TaxID=3375149 RepID=UPI00379CD220